jgi:hypothetical protein
MNQKTHRLTDSQTRRLTDIQETGEKNMQAQRKQFLPAKLSDDQVLALATAVSRKIGGPEVLAICDFHREAYAEFWTRYLELVSQTIERRCELFYDPWEEYADMDYVDDHYRMNYCARERRVSAG